MQKNDFPEAMMDLAVNSPPLFYENKIVDGDFVIVQVTELNSYSAQVVCLEYGNFPGRILYNELSMRNFGSGSLSKITKMGARECCLVLHVGANELSLSKKRVSQEVKQEFFNRYQKSMKVLQIMEEFVSELSLGVSENTTPIINKIASNLQLSKELHMYYRNIVYQCHNLYGHAYDAFRECLINKEKKENIFSKIFNPQRVCWRENTREELKRKSRLLFECIKRRLRIRPIKIRATVEVSCFSPNGIESIKDALMHGRNSCGSDVDIHINLIAHPIFSLTCLANDVQSGKKYLIRAMQFIKERILQEKEGKFKCIEAPNEMSQKAESTLAIIMQRLETENKEIDGDDDFEEGLEIDPALEVRF